MNFPKIILFSFLFLLFGCSAQQTLESLSKLQFKIDSISDFRLQDIRIDNKTEIADFSSTELLKLITGFTKENLPASFTVNISVKDPTASLFDLELKIVSFPWELYVNDKKIIAGNISGPIDLKGDSTIKRIRIKISLNIFKMVNESNIEELLKAVLYYGGSNATANDISIYAQPVISSIIGEMKYPEKIKIVSYEYK